jgi:hypothetical protein
MKNLFILMILCAIYTNLYAEIPNWYVPDGFEQNMTVACRVYINDVAEEDSTNLVGAFVGEEVRGVNSGPFYDLSGVFVTLVNVASNTIGEEISFKLYDASNDVILPITETLTVNNDGYGTYLDPEEFHAISEAPGDVPTVTPGLATNITESSATLNGTINPNNLETTYYFEYGMSTSYGTQTSQQNLSAGADDVPVDADISGLAAGTIYHFRLVATNSEGTTYGEDMLFPTVGSVPVVITEAATAIGENTFTMNGIINPGGLETTYYFGYGEFQTTPQIIPAGTENVAVSIILPNVMDGATFYYQLVATNATGTTEGEIQTVTTIFDPLHDVNNDGDVDVQDVQEVIEHYGDEYY